MQENMNTLKRNVALLQRNLKKIGTSATNPVIKARATRCLNLLDEILGYKLYSLHANKEKAEKKAKELRKPIPIWPAPKFLYSDVKVKKGRNMWGVYYKEMKQSQ
jgi:hypothetical protein